MGNIDLLVETLEKGRLLKEALIIIDKLADNDFADIDGDVKIDDFDSENLKNLIIKARTLKKNRWWNLT